MGFFQPSCFGSLTYLFLKIRNEFISWLILLLFQACLNKQYQSEASGCKSQLKIFRTLSHCFQSLVLPLYFRKEKEVCTCPAARTLPSVEKVQQSPLFRGATCTGYSSSILQNLTILRGKHNIGSYQSRFLSVLGAFCMLHKQLVWSIAQAPGAQAASWEVPGRAGRQQQEGQQPRPTLTCRRPGWPRAARRGWSTRSAPSGRWRRPRRWAWAGGTGACGQRHSLSQGSSSGTHKQAVSDSPPCLREWGLNHHLLFSRV